MTQTKEPTMSVSATIPPADRGYLLRAWLLVAAIVAVAAVVVVMGLVRTTGAAGSSPAPIKQLGSVTTSHEPIMVGGTLCGQCR